MKPYRGKNPTVHQTQSKLFQIYHSRIKSFDSIAIANEARTPNQDVPLAFFNYLSVILLHALLIFSTTYMHVCTVCIILSTFQNSHT